mgnify:CR=1 FL=1
MSTDAEYEAIQREMAIARREMYAGARDVVTNAKELTDWRHYVREYPWLSIGAAFAVGYIVISPIARTIISTRSRRREDFPERDRKPVKEQASWTSSALSFVSSTALRLAMAYAGQHLGNWLTSQENVNAGSPSASLRTQPKDAFRNGQNHATTH